MDFSKIQGSSQTNSCDVYDAKHGSYKPNVPAENLEGRTLAPNLPKQNEKSPFVPGSVSKADGGVKK